MKRSDIEILRKEITYIDEALLNLLHERRAISVQIARLKKCADLPVLDTDREKHLFKLIKQKARELQLDVGFVERLWGVILKNSRQEQQYVLSKEGKSNLM